MKVGDLIKVPDCIQYDECFFCYSKSSRIGILLRFKGICAFEGIDQTGGRWWKAKFDVGEWEICEREFELYHDMYEQLEVTLNESR